LGSRVSKEDISDCKGLRDVAICDTTVHKGQRGVTTATNFGTKIAINVHKCISARDNENAITYNREFSWSTNPKMIFLIPRVYGTLPRQPNFGRNRPKNHKNSQKFSFKPHIHAVWF